MHKVITLDHRPLRTAGSVDRSAIGCVACSLLVGACALDIASVSTDLMDWPAATAALILITGMPHGALDMELLRRRKHNTGNLAFTRSLIAYVGAAFATLLMWWAVPGLALSLFLVLAAYHFGSDWSVLTTTGRSVAGAALIAAPAMLHQDSVVSIFSWLVPESAALLIGSAMHQTSFVLALAVGFVVVANWDAHRAECEEIAIVVLAASLLLPLTFFVIYFCGLHSMRHLHAVQQELSAERTTVVMASGACVGIIAIACCCIGALYMPGLTIGPALLSATFIGLSGLTVPHMLLEKFP